jgi:hypothetical protein
MVPVLLARPGSKAPDDTPFDDDPNLMNFAVMMFCIVCWMSCQL